MMLKKFFMRQLIQKKTKQKNGIKKEARCNKCNRLSTIGNLIFKTICPYCGAKY